MKKKALSLVALAIALLIPITASAAVDLLGNENEGANPKVAVILDIPLVVGDEDKTKEAIIEKINEWFPPEKYELIDFDQTQLLVEEYREENDMVIYSENTREYKPLKITDIQSILNEHAPDLVVNARFSRGMGKTVMTFWSRRTKINVETDIRVLDFKTGKYIQRYQKTAAVGSGDVWGGSSASRSYRKGIIEGMAGFVPDHTKY
jgi:hypothetical protein